MKKLLIFLHSLTLTLALALLLLPVKHSNDAQMDVLKSLRDLEIGFQDYLNQAKKEIHEAFEDKETQSFSRSALRKRFSFDRKSDLLNSPIRISIYEARSRSGKDYPHPLFEDYKPAVIWDKILPALLGEALRQTGEGKPEVEDGLSKFTEMASVLMPNAKKISFKTPGEFIDLKLMGEDTLFYWNLITKRCPQRIRRALEIDSCLKGLFVAEIDKKVLLKKYWNTLEEKENSKVFLAFLDQADQQEYVFQLFPPNEAKNQYIFDSIQKAMNEPLPYLKTEESVFYGAVRFQGAVDSIVGIIGEWEGAIGLLLREQLLLILLFVSLLASIFLALSKH